jgi:hypothetical protein
MISIGSILWRVHNYGAIPALKYIISKFTKFEISNYNIITELYVFNAKTYQVNEKNLVQFIQIYELVFNSVLIKYNNLQASGQTIKSGIIGPKDSQTKFIILSYFLYFNTLDLILETGTQYGCSSLIMEEFLWHTEKIDQTKIHSFDVKRFHQPKNHGYLHLEILDTPLRKNFKKISSEIAEKNGNILFFHDSDHSTENMKFEFDWAWNKLLVKLLISDDVDENSAFISFAKKINIEPILCKFDHGPTVGILIR